MVININELNVSKHPISQYTNDIRDIVEPLKKTAKIEHFSYQRSYANTTPREQIFFTTHPSFTENIFIPEKFYELAFCADPDEYQDALYLWAFFEKNIVHQAVKENLGFAHGITIIKKKTNHCEFFYFGTGEKNNLINAFFINNLFLFESFISEFEEKTKKILSHAEKNKFIVPESAGDQTIIPAQQYFNILNTNKYIPSKKHLVKTISSQKKQSNITPRELNCAQLIIKGLNAKQIARQFNISKRTVEKHIEHLKFKMGAKTLVELAVNLLHNNIIFNNKNIS